MFVLRRYPLAWCFSRFGWPVARQNVDREKLLKSYEEIMEILEAFALTDRFRDTAVLAGCSHHTVAHCVGLRDEGRLPTLLEPTGRPKLIDPHLAKIEEWVDRSHGKVRADVVHGKLLLVGFTGSERTVRRTVARVKQQYRAGRRRVYLPWIREPSMWAQWDRGQGPTIAGRSTNLFVPGWRGRGSGWSSPLGTAPCPPWSGVWIGLCALSAAAPPTGPPTTSGPSPSTMWPGSLCAIR